MIWKDYLKLSEIASYSKLTRASKAPPPPSLLGGIGITSKEPNSCAVFSFLAQNYITTAQRLDGHSIRFQLHLSCSANSGNSLSVHDN